MFVGFALQRKIRRKKMETRLITMRSKPDYVEFVLLLLLAELEIVAAPRHGVPSRFGDQQ